MNYNVPIDYQINIIKKSTIRTLNNYQKSEVMEALLDCLKKGLIIDANYWAAELFASGFYLHLWDCLFKFYFQQINLMNPNFIDYLNQKYLLLSQIKKLYVNNTKNLCNNQELRNHLAEIVTLLCSAEKIDKIIPLTTNNSQIDEQMNAKTNKIIQIIAPYLSPQSLLYEQYRLFIINYYSDVENCLYYIHWFIKDNEHTINTFEEFKVPVTMAQKSMWLIWKFILIQYKNIKNRKINYNLTDLRIEQITDLLELLVNLYIMIYKRKDYETCSYLLLFIVNISKCPDEINWSAIIDITDPAVIRQCAEINKVYSHLQLSSKKIKDNPSGKKGKKEIEKRQFYENPKNIEFIRLINNYEAIRSGFDHELQSMDSENDEDSESQEIISIDWDIN